MRNDCGTPTIRLLGSVELLAAPDRVASFATRKSRLLFAFLVLSRGRVMTREAIAAQFWRDLPEAQGRRALNTDLWRVREALSQAGLEPDRYLHSGADGIGFHDRAEYWLDTAQVEVSAHYAAATSPEAAGEERLRAVEDATLLFRGDLLQDVFEVWCLVQREAFRAAQLRMLDFAMRARMARGEWRRALVWGERLLGIDGLQEHVHRAMMRCHCGLGNRPAAVHQYQACLELLRRELGVSPMEETRRAYHAILARGPAGADAAPAAVMAAMPHACVARPEASVLDAVGLAIASIDTARACLLGARASLRSEPDG